jgi:putative SOS response-associated peptidase YedK
MCNDYRDNIPLEQLEIAFSETRIPLRFPEGRPNRQPRDDIRITDRASIVRSVGEGDEAAELVTMRWSWPGAGGGKPVYNFRSEGREFAQGRCLIIADGFYEFTTPAPVEGHPKPKLKDKWLFTMRGEPLFAIAGLWRAETPVGEAFTMLTVEPGPDIAPYHSRQIVPLARKDWSAWLNPAVPAAEILRPSPAGTLDVVQIR